MFRILIFLLGLIILFSSVSASPIDDMIKKGRIEEARQEIARLSTASLRDGNLLHFQALIEEDGESSFQFLEAAIGAGLSPEFLEENTFMMALFYMVEGYYKKLETTASAYLQWWENGRYRSDMLRLDAFANLRNDKKELANRLLGNLINENEGTATGAIGLLDRAAVLYDKEAYIQAQNICRRLANTRFDNVIAPALYMLSYYAIEQNRIDDAILYYNLLKEGYPHAIGLDDLVDKFTGIESKNKNQTAEEITGTFYSVQVGVFSVRDNAKTLSRSMKKYGKKVEVKEKKISEKNYFVVYVGRFKSTDDAIAFKTILEKSENEAFQVVAR